ncbi:MAG: YifB family Mg chelatase-like AAA ATPase [Alphaproteobacteria bacterium]|jgi:magnesium chelatase family protein|nr:YifB family Mg chelatase-like AAA ATPase [Alphaproteobacteria bacterium]
MVVAVHTLALQGLQGTPVQIEVQLSGGQPGVFIIGLAGNAVKESRDRVRGALHALGIALPDKRITVNLSPADLTKDGSHYDLPIACALLAAFGVIPADVTHGLWLFGELGLDGSVRGVPGCLPAALYAAQAGAQLVLVPSANAAEAAWANQAGRVGVLGVPSLHALIRHFRGEELLAPATPQAAAAEPYHAPDLRDIRGQEGAKRAAEIAAAGGHHLLLSGPPGSGKSMLASRLPALLPPLTAAEALEVSMVHSVAGLKLPDSGLLTTRPFRDPHHSASAVSLTGGGLKGKPGEMSLAHRGVLFLDELPEFPRAVLETLRQPLETGSITIARAAAHVTYPARFQLIAAMNPCACGYLGDAKKGCKSQPGCAQQYQNRLSGPLLDRFDLRVSVPAVKAEDLSLPPAKEGTAVVAARVRAARERQAARLQGRGAICNAELTGQLLEETCVLEAESRQLLNAAAEKMGLSARGYHRVLRVARTLADLAAAPHIGKPHVAEALAYRVG